MPKVRVKVKSGPVIKDEKPKPKWRGRRPISERGKREPISKTNELKAKVVNKGRPVYDTVSTTKYMRPEEKYCSDPVLAYDQEDRRVFGYNAEGRPVCFSKLRKPRVMPDGTVKERCMSEDRKQNGRCRLHGGNSVKGVDHWNATHLRTAHELPVHMQNDMRRAALDPDLLSCDHELHMLDLREAQLKRDLDIGLSETAERTMDGLITTLDSVIGTEKCTEELLQRIIDTWQGGKSQAKNWKEIRQLQLERTKIVDTAHRRERDLKQMMHFDQAMTLITAVGAAVRGGVPRLIRAIEERYQLVDKSTNLPITSIDAKLGENFVTDIGTKLSRMVSGGGTKGLGEPTDVIEGEITDLVRQ